MDEVKTYTISSQNLAASKIAEYIIGYQLKLKTWTPPFFYFKIKFR